MTTSSGFMTGAYGVPACTAQGAAMFYLVNIWLYVWCGVLRPPHMFISFVFSEYDEQDTPASYTTTPSGYPGEEFLNT